VTVVPNGIDPRHFLTILDSEGEKRRLGLSGRFVLGFVGFIREWHGLQHVLQIVKSIGDPDIVFLVVGDGPGRAELERRAESLGLSGALKVTGVLGREDIPGWIAAFDVALQPAVTEYASPLKLFEYMALGKAVVAPRSPNIEEILTDGENALLFPPGDTAAFEECVTRLYRDDALRTRLGAAARRTIVEGGYTWDENARRLEALFLQTLVARGRAPLPASRAPP
jgi:glycosyltransferase involved in cell wall biosynthesis